MVLAKFLLEPGDHSATFYIAAPASRCGIFVIATDEEQIIADEAVATLTAGSYVEHPGSRLCSNTNPRSDSV